MVASAPIIAPINSQFGSSPRLCLALLSFDVIVVAAVLGGSGCADTMGALLMFLDLDSFLSAGVDVETAEGSLGVAGVADNLASTLPIDLMCAVNRPSVPALSPFAITLVSMIWSSFDKSQCSIRSVNSLAVFIFKFSIFGLLALRIKIVRTFMPRRFL